MSDTEREAMQTARPRRRWRRLFNGAIVLCVVALFVAWAAWTSSPQWYTYVSQTSSVEPHTALVLRVPIGWECRESVDRVASFDPLSSRINVNITHKPLSGFLKWWEEQVLHWDPHQHPSGGGTVTLHVMPGDFLVDKRPRVDLAPGVGRTVRRAYEHALGPAARQTTQASLARHGQQSVLMEDAVVINVRRHPENTCVVVTGDRTYLTPGADRFQSTWQEIVFSIRVVQK